MKHSEMDEKFPGEPSGGPEQRQREVGEQNSFPIQGLHHLLLAFRNLDNEQERHYIYVVTVYSLYHPPLSIHLNIMTLKHLKPILIIWVSVSLISPPPLWVPSVIRGGQGRGTHHSPLEKALWSVFVNDLLFHALNLGSCSSVSVCTGVKSLMNPKILWSSRLDPVYNEKFHVKPDITLPVLCYHISQIC